MAALAVVLGGQPRRGRRGEQSRLVNQSVLARSMAGTLVHQYELAIA